MKMSKEWAESNIPKEGNQEIGAGTFIESKKIEPLFQKVRELREYIDKAPRSLEGSRNKDKEIHKFMKENNIEYEDTVTLIRISRRYPNIKK